MEYFNSFGGNPVSSDVRGHGLFLGIELVRDLESLDPADKEADQIVNTMKEKGILISTDGPDHNILKIKPPLVFNRENALFLTETLDEILSWDKDRLYT